MTSNTIQELQETLRLTDSTIYFLSDRISELQSELNGLYEDRYDIEQQLIDAGNPPDLTF